ncbi:MAG: hypothetical protein WCJ61_13760 [Paludibacter sp.]
MAGKLRSADALNEVSERKNYMQKLFKVVDKVIINEVVINTDTQNYSSVLTKAEELKEYLEIMTLISSNCTIPISVLATINNGIALFGQDYLQQLPLSKNGLFTADQITKQDADKQFLMKEADIVSFIDMIDKIGFKSPFEGYYIWEYLFERARPLINSDLPKRDESFFLFETITDCERYIKEYKANGKICQVELVEVKKSFRADMNILNEIPNNFTASDVLKSAIKYWDEQSSTNPFYEIIFQGKCILKPL